MKPALPILILAICAGPGCTNLALQQATVSQATSASDLRYKQVIENLAMLSSDPSMLPAFSSIYAGSTDVTDTLTASSASGWLRHAAKAFRYSTFYANQSADFMGSRAVKANWTLDPTVVPEKLRAMRAACQWVIVGPENVGPDVKYLLDYVPDTYVEDQDAQGNYRGMKCVPGSGSGFYFNVAKRLDYIQQQPPWLHHSDRYIDIPHRACYWAHCGGHYVWVEPEGMECLSQFLLVLQSIARCNIASAHFPRAQTRQIQKDFEFRERGKNYIATATINVDELGRLVPVANAPVVPIKTRIDNVGKYSDLQSIINVTSKSP
jgi:hypothetical protein